MLVWCICQANTTTSTHVTSGATNEVTALFQKKETTILRAASHPSQLCRPRNAFSPSLRKKIYFSPKSCLLCRSESEVNRVTWCGTGKLGKSPSDPPPTRHAIPLHTATTQCCVCLSVHVPTFLLSNKMLEEESREQKLAVSEGESSRES